MSLYNKLVSVTEGTEMIPEVTIVNESEYLGNSIVELTQDLFRVMEASDIADIIGEHQVVSEGASAEVVLENIIMGGFEKLKAAFVKFWNKIKAFFAEIKKQIKLLFMKCEKFVKEFEAELKAKKAKGYKYMSHKYSFDSGVSQTTGIFDGVMGRIEKLLGVDAGKAADMNDSDKLKELIASASGDGYKTDEKYEETVIKRLKSGCESIGELKTELAKAFRGGNEASDKEELEDFEGSSVTDMIKFIKESGKKISELEKKETKFNSTMSNIIKKIDNLATKKETSDSSYKFANMLSSYLTTLLNIGKAPIDVEVTAIKEISSAYESILKGYIRFKPAKESYVGESTVPSNSLFESVYANM